MIHSNEVGRFATTITKVIFKSPLHFAFSMSIVIIILLMYSLTVAEWRVLESNVRSGLVDVEYEYSLAACTTQVRSMDTNHRLHLNTLRAGHRAESAQCKGALEIVNDTMDAKIISAQAEAKIDVAVRDGEIRGLYEKTKLMKSMYCQTKEGQGAKVCS